MQKRYLMAAMAGALALSAISGGASASQNSLLELKVEKEADAESEAGTSGLKLKKFDTKGADMILGSWQRSDASGVPSIDIGVVKCSSEMGEAKLPDGLEEAKGEFTFFHAADGLYLLHRSPSSVFSFSDPGLYKLVHSQLGVAGGVTIHNFPHEGGDREVKIYRMEAIANDGKSMLKLQSQDSSKFLLKCD